MTTEIQLAKQHGIQYRLTPEGTTEMWCHDRNVQAFAEALVAAERKRWTLLLTEKWHAGEGKGKTLAQYMGMSDAEYAAWGLK